MVCERLRGELQRALEKQRKAGQPSLALSRTLGVNRNICQRVTAGLDPRLDPLTALTKLPGPDGLLLLAGALAALNERDGLAPRASRRTALTAAIDAYAGFIRAAGGSQAGLIRRIEMSARGREGAADNLATRRRLFDVALDLQGHAADTVISIAAVRPITGSTQFTEGLSVKGFFGLRALSAPVSLEMRNFTLRHQAQLVAVETQHEPLSGNAGAGLNLIEEFCSRPLPSSVFDPFDGGARTIIEPGAERVDPVDIVMGTRWRPYLHPTLHDDVRWWTALRIDRPVRRAVFDVYLHRSLAAACVPSIGCYLWHPGFTGNPAIDWHCRLPGRYTLELLGAGIAQAPSAAWQRHAALTARALELAGWPADELVGFRCDAAFPTWGSVLSMSFDFNGATASHPGPTGA